MPPDCLTPENNAADSLSRNMLLTLYRPAMPLGNRKKYFQDLFSSVLSELKKYHTSGNLKLYNLGILKSLKLRILVKKSFQFLLS